MLFFSGGGGDIGLCLEVNGIRTIRFNPQADWTGSNILQTPIVLIIAVVLVFSEKNKKFVGLC